jgi:hypothetical protein
MTQKDVKVETYSSFAYAVEPRAFVYENARHRVEEIQRMWKTPGRIHFFVRDKHERFFELTYGESGDAWQLRAFGESCSIPNTTTRTTT